MEEKREMEEKRKMEEKEKTEGVNVEIPVAKESDKVGLPPGALIYVDDDGKSDETLREKGVIRLIQYNESGYTEKRILDPEELNSMNREDKISWIHLTGLWNVEIVQKIGEIFQISPLVLEDILNMEQRPKTEDFESYFFTALKQIWLDADSRKIRDNQIGIITMDRTVITFCEEDPHIFKSVVDRIKKDGRIRKYGADNLTYALMDIVVDHYFYVLEGFEEWLDDIEKRIIKKADKEGAEEINDLRHELSTFKKSVWPLVTVTERLEKSDSKLIKKQTRVLFRDVFDHVIRITESIETDHEILTGIYDLYTTGISNRLNETMRILTVISTIFIPLTFIAGVYGMNFKYMPELYWEYSYYGCLGLMAIIVVIMIVFFRKKEWI